MTLTARSIGEIVEVIEDAIDDTFSRRAMRTLGDEMAAVIRARSKRGLGVDRDGGAERRFNRLSPRYVRQRRRRRSQLASWTSPRTSNVTFSGEMLSEFKAIQSRDGTVTLGFRRRKAGQKAVWTHQGGRPWANLSKNEIEWLADYADESLGRSFRARRL